MEVAAREDVLPALYGNLQCPAEISDLFDAVHELNADRNCQILKQIENLASLLNQAGIEPVLLKGSAYLAAGVYPDPAHRFLLDIDLLASPEQSHHAFELFQRSGYEPQIPNPTALVRHHHPVLTRANCVPVEVHHSLGMGLCNRFLPAGEVISHSVPFRIGQATVRIPSPEHLMTHLIMHSQMHHGSYDRIWPSLRSMLDLVLLTRCFPIAWDSIRCRFRSYGKSTLLDLHLLQVEKVMDFSRPFPIAGSICWRYRQVLWNVPALRYIDPGYLLSRSVTDRFHLSKCLFNDPRGRKYVLSTPFRRGFYKRLLTEIVRG